MISVNIPAGVADGMQLKMSGRGNDAPGGGIAGDLLIAIEEVADSRLQRDGNDLNYNLMIDFPTAALGGKVEVPTVDGHVLMTIKPGTQPGTLLRLRGKGLPSTDRYGMGDLLVRVMVYVPENLSDDERRAVEQMGRSSNIVPTEAAKRKILSRLRQLFD